MKIKNKRSKGFSESAAIYAAKNSYRFTGTETKLVQFINVRTGEPADTSRPGFDKAVDKFFEAVEEARRTGKKLMLLKRRNRI